MMCETLSTYSAETENSNEQSKDADYFPPVVELNVGGVLFTTTLSTLRRYPESLLGAMFSGRHKVLRDAYDRPFIDFDPERFRPVLEFLRSDELPSPSSDRLVDLYRSASYFAIEALCERLVTTAPVAKVLVRQSYRDRFIGFDRFRRDLVKLATKKASLDAGNWGAVNVLVGRRSMDKTEKAHSCIRSSADLDIAVYKKTVTEESYEDDLLRCVRQCLISDGFTVAAGVYHRMFCSGGCPLSVEKFEFQF